MKSIPLILIVAVLAPAQVTRQANDVIVVQSPAPTNFDCAADGTVVNSVTGEPIARARVNVIGAAGYSTVTDGSGRWVLNNMACAPGPLQVTRPGFLQNMGLRVLRLISGSPVHDLKTELIPQSVALGKVLDDQGDPVQGAQVTTLVTHVVDGRPQFQQTGSGMTNDLGEYRIANLSRGKYILCVHFNQPGGPLPAALAANIAALQAAVQAELRAAAATGGPQQAASQTIAADTCYPGPIEGGAASAMDLPAARESKVDFTLNAVAAVHVRGSVTGLPEGRASAGVNLVKRSGAELGGSYANAPGTVRDGKFDFRVPPGSYMLRSDFFDSGKRFTARVPVDVGSADIDNVVVHLDSGFSVTGNVRVVSQSGETTTRRFPVNLRASEPGSNTKLQWDPDHNSFTVEELTPGSYRLDVNPPPPFYVKSATLGGQDMLNNEVPISQAAGPIEILLRDDGGSIEGDVVDANGQPVRSGIILLRGTIRVASMPAELHFKLQNVGPGDYTIYAWDYLNEVQYADPDWMRRNGGGGLAVTVTAGQNQQIKLTQQLVPQQ